MCNYCFIDDCGYVCELYDNKKLQEQIRNLEKGIEDVEQAHSKQHFEHIDYVDQLNNNAQDEMNKLYSYTDSRVDKVINELERIKRTYIKEY